MLFSQVFARDKYHSVHFEARRVASKGDALAAHTSSFARIRREGGEVKHDFERLDHFLETFIIYFCPRVFSTHRPFYPVSPQVPKLQFIAKKFNLFLPLRHHRPATADSAPFRRTELSVCPISSHLSRPDLPLPRDHGFLSGFRHPPRPEAEQNTHRYTHTTLLKPKWPF